VLFLSFLPSWSLSFMSLSLCNGLFLLYSSIPKIFYYCLLKNSICISCSNA
jgi:hypothetical protein